MYLLCTLPVPPMMSQRQHKLLQNLDQAILLISSAVTKVHNHLNLDYDWTFWRWIHCLAWIPFVLAEYLWISEDTVIFSALGTGVTRRRYCVHWIFLRNSFLIDDWCVHHCFITNSNFTFAIFTMTYNLPNDSMRTINAPICVFIISSPFLVAISFSFSEVDLECWDDNPFL